MFHTFVFATIIAVSAAFKPFTAVPVRSGMKMSAEGMVGSLAPVGFFDPLGLSAGKSPAQLKKYREAELKHGRVAMLAFLGIITAENFNPLFDGKITGPAIYHFQQADNLLSYFWTLVLLGVGMVEGQNILVGWESESGPSGVADLKEDYVNGDLGFDPLGLKPKTEEAFDEMRTKELQNGRLAMLGTAGIVAQELVNYKGVIQNLLV